MLEASGDHRPWSTAIDRATVVAMTNGIELVGVRLPAVALARLDEIVAREGGTRAEVASQLLVTVLERLGDPKEARQLAYSLLDLDEDLAGP